MTEKNQQILDLIEQEKTLNEISAEVKLSNKQIHNRITGLKIHGYNFDRKFYYDGEIVYKLIKNMKKYDEVGTTIITSHNNTTFRAVLISDLHLGSIEDNVPALNAIYNYCVKHGINIILNAGDFIDGTYGGMKRTFDIEEMIKYSLKNHPFDKNILNFVCMGNHDCSTLEDYGLNFLEVVSNRRPDIIPVGYGYGIINIKNDQLILNHRIDNIPFQKDEKNKLIIKGHTHFTKIYGDGNHNRILYLPSLSDIDLVKGSAFPCAFYMELIMKNGYVNRIILNQLLVTNNNVLKLNELDYPIGDKTLINQTNKIKNEEERKFCEENSTDKIKTLNSQVEKFNQKYGRIK